MISAASLLSHASAGVVAAPSTTQLANRFQALLLKMQTAAGSAGANASQANSTAGPGGLHSANAEADQTSGTPSAQAHHHHGSEGDAGTQQDGDLPSISTASGTMAQALRSYASNGAWHMPAAVQLSS